MREVELTFLTVLVSIAEMMDFANNALQTGTLSVLFGAALFRLIKEIKSFKNGKGQ